MSLRPGLLLLALLLVPSLGLSTTSAFPLRGLDLGAAAPGFELQDAKGRSHALSALRGKVVVLAYVRPDQDYSAKVLGALTRLRRRYPEAEVAVLGVRRPDEPGASAVEAGLGFPVLLDPERSLYAAWGLFVLPTTVVLDPKHRVVFAVSTFPEGMEDDLLASVDESLGRPRSAAKPKKAAAPAAPPEIGMARGLMASGRPAEVLDVLRPVLAAPSAPVDVLLLASEASLALGKVPEAAARAEAAERAEPGSLRVALLLGRVRTLQGRYQEAEALLKKAAMGPESGQARYRLGQLHERQGRKDAALEEYRAALEASLGR
ncbi:MAG: redoxin domain-containing protein [Elusimicrobia bacterium]|nr:redoxin domain-containing protein [Elusimicrobiota bacterium]